MLLSTLVPAKDLKNLKFIPVEGAPNVALTVIWKKEFTNSAVPLFLEHVARIDWQ
jgi:hypothetical protein